MVSLGITDSVGAQQVEWQVQSVHTFRRAGFSGAGVGISLRFPGRTAFGLSTSAGSVSAGLAFRSELSVRFHLVSTLRAKTSAYATSGLAFENGVDLGRQYIYLAAGLETRPVIGLRLFLEGGFGGGVRLSTGLRFIP